MNSGLENRSGGGDKGPYLEVEISSHFWDEIQPVPLFEAARNTLTPRGRQRIWHPLANAECGVNGAKPLAALARAELSAPQGGGAFLAPTHGTARREPSRAKASVKSEATHRDGKRNRHEKGRVKTGDKLRLHSRTERPTT